MMNVGLTYDLKSDWALNSEDPQDANAELDKPETIESICAALEWGGHQVRRIGNVNKLFDQIKDLDVDIVFNIAEGRRGRNRESQVPTLLELKGIPFVGSDALTLGMTLDKVVAKKCFIADGVPTPGYFVARDVADLKNFNHLAFPLIVKTIYEGTSKGLTEASRVLNKESLKQQVAFITQTYHQPALIEEFIAGTEFTVAVLGNDEPQAMPIVQVSIDDDTNLGDKFYTFERVSSTNLRYVCPAKISKELTRQIQQIAVRAYQSVGCRDFGRVDFRVDEKGTPFVLEINPLPSLERADVFNIFPQQIGSTYEETINRVLNFALKRYGMKPAAKVVEPV
jgi:D-alanine-D-alanine ligase